VTLGAGGTYPLNSTLRLVVEGGYELGFQGTTVLMGQAVDYKVKIFELGVGLQFTTGH
jgi:hypothetical protein